MNKLVWTMFVVACTLIFGKVLDSCPPFTATSNPVCESQRSGNPAADGGTQGVVTAIVYSGRRPSAIVGGRIVYEADTIGDVSVVRIEKNRVHFEKRGTLWTQEVQEPPAKHWK